MLIYDNTTHWSLISAIFYVVLGLFAVKCMHGAKKAELVSGREAGLRSKYIFSWCFLWLFFAVFRLVDLHVGGTDAPDYIYYFTHCNDGVRTNWFDHVEGDLGFKWLNKIVRAISSDYHVYFGIAYGFMIFAYIKFLIRFSPIVTNVAPYLLTFFLVLRSFNTVRTNIVIALIALGCTFIIQKRWLWAYVFAFSAILFHKSAVIYAMVVPFCHFFSYKKINIKWAILLIIGSALIGRSLQSFFLQYAAGTDLNGAYASYAARSIGGSFFNNAWKIAFEQIFLGVVMLLLNSRIGKNHNEQDRTRIKIIWLICIFDLILVPINFIIGSWRGYEFFYLARIVMWGECLYQLSKILKKEYQVGFTIAALILFIAWMVFRISATFNDSHLMPYIFEPLLSL